MTLVLDKFRNLLPTTKTNPSGWTSFNAPCCHNRGHSKDTRKRAGVMFSDGIVYNCLNCKYIASWQPGRQISEKFKSLCKWLGANDTEINELIFEALKTESIDYIPSAIQSQVKFDPKELPDESLLLSEWISIQESAYEANILAVTQYLLDRGFDPLSDQFYWSPIAGYDNRVIIPFIYQGQIVGNTARKIVNGRPKYLSDQPPNFVFNMDQQDEKNRYIFVTEGPFDAISIGGVALLTNDLSDQQARMINNLGKEVIVVPDQDTAGLQLILKAIEYNWSVAFPTWSDDIKDPADAVLKYGKLFVLVDIIQTAQTGHIKIQMAMKQLQQRIKMYEENT